MFFLNVRMAKIIGRYSSGITRQFQKWAIRIRTGDVRVAIVKGNPAAAIKRFTRSVNTDFNVSMAKFTTASLISGHRCPFSFTKPAQINLSVNTSRETVFMRLDAFDASFLKVRWHLHEIINIPIFVLFNLAVTSYAICTCIESQIHILMAQEFRIAGDIKSFHFRRTSLLIHANA